MFYEKMEDTYAVRLDRGDEVMACLKDICAKEEIELGEISGLGAADQAEIGLYSVKEQCFHKTVLEGEMEITSLVGSVTRQGREVYLHLHINLGFPDGSVRGGHLSSCRISGTGELFIRALHGRIGRKKDEATGLNVFAFEHEDEGRPMQARMR